MMRLPTPGLAARPSGLQQSPYPPVGQFQFQAAAGKSRLETQSGDGHGHPDTPSATGLRIFSCRVGVARELLSENLNTPFSVMFRIYGSLLQIISPESGPGRNRNRKYLIISDLAAKNLRIRCFFQVF